MPILNANPRFAMERHWTGLMTSSRPCSQSSFDLQCRSLDQLKGSSSHGKIELMRFRSSAVLLFALLLAVTAGCRKVAVLTESSGPVTVSVPRTYQA